MRALVVGLLCLVACGDNAPRNACPGARPQLSECFVGNSFAECGGSGEPTFACGGEGECLWFSDGCVAEGFVASDCAAEHVCCHDNSPYLERDHLFLVWNFTTAYGTEPWDRSRATLLAASIDPLLTATADAITCTGPRLPLGPRDACDGGDAGAWLANDTVVAQLMPPDQGPSGWFYVVEVIPEAVDGLAARLCVYRYDDVVIPCASSEPICAASGGVRISRWPTSRDDTNGLVMALDATFANGLHIEATMVDEAAP